MEQLISAGIIIALIGFALVIIGVLLTTLKSKQAKTEGGFVFWIGPIPIVGATSKAMLLTLLISSIIFLLLFILLNLLGK